MYKPIIILRTLAERLSRGKIIKRHLPSTFKSIPFYVTTDSQIRYVTIGENAFDSDLLRVAKEEINPQSVVWDIGANVGVFSFAAASQITSGSVLAVEPDIWLAQIIMKSISLKENKNLNIQVLPAAVSNKNGVATFLIAKRGRASNALESAGGRSQMGGIREKVFVPTLTLDTLLNAFHTPDFVKIDIEGAEIQALGGGKKLLTEVRPIIYIEIGLDFREVISKIFLENNYALFDGAATLQKRREIPICTFNTLAIPREKV